MRWRTALAVLGVAACVVLAGWRFARQTPEVRPVDEQTLREYTGVYRSDGSAFLYLQLWHEFSGFTKPGQLVAFDESGVVRVLYQTERDHFFTGPGAAVADRVESRIDVQRDEKRAITSLTWRRGDGPSRTWQRVESEKREDVRFANGDIRLAGTLLSPVTDGKHSALILVHGSGGENREFILPWARFLVRRGVAVLGYDKRGVGGSTGDWQTASFADLAADVVAAFNYLKTRGDVDSEQIGLIGLSQAGWIMPLAANRATGIAFVISISGAGVPPAETTLDQARNEMTAAGMRGEAIDQVIELMTRQYEYARTGDGWASYRATREKTAAMLGGTPPPAFPGTQDDPQWGIIRRQYFHDPAPSLRQLKSPLLAMWGALDHNIVADKNRTAVEAALKAGGHPDNTLRVLPAANHYLWRATTGTNRELASSQGFSPEYFTIVQDWLAKRIRGFRPG